MNENQYMMIGYKGYSMKLSNMLIALLSKGIEIKIDKTSYTKKEKPNLNSLMVGIILIQAMLLMLFLIL
jgi:hypothetical protein